MKEDLVDRKVSMAVEKLDDLIIAINTIPALKKWNVTDEEIQEVRELRNALRLLRARRSTRVLAAAGGAQ